MNKSAIARAIAELPCWATYHTRIGFFFACDYQQDMAMIDLEGSPLNTATVAIQHFECRNHLKTFLLNLIKYHQHEDAIKVLEMAANE